MNELKARIKQHEGCRLRPYEDSLGVLTVGYGRNLRDVPFTEAEVELMFETDFERAKRAAQAFFIYELLDDPRKGVLIELCFQLGPRGVSGFKNMLKAMERKDWHRAAEELLDSRYATQVPNRAKALADILRG